MNSISVVFSGWLWMKHEKMNQGLLFVPCLSAWPHTRLSVPSQRCHGVYEALVGIVWGWLATVPFPVASGVCQDSTHVSQNHSLASCTFPPKNPSPRSWALGISPSHTTFLRTHSQSEEEGEMDACSFLVLLPDCVLAWVTGSSVWGPPLDSVVRISANKQTARCSVVLGAEPWVQVPLLALTPMSCVTSSLWVSQEGQGQESIRCISSRLWIHSFHLGHLKLATVEVFLPWKLAIAFTLTQDSAVSIDQHPTEGTCLAKLCLQSLESTCSKCRSPGPHCRPLKSGSSGPVCDSRDLHIRHWGFLMRGGINKLHILKGPF